MARLTEKRQFENHGGGERVTALCVDGHTGIIEPVPSEWDPLGIDIVHYYIVGEAVDKLAAYEDAEERGEWGKVVHGRWIGYHEADFGWDEYGVRCSNCEFEVEDRDVKFSMNYCPNCGAKMDEEG